MIELTRTELFDAAERCLSKARGCLDESFGSLFRPHDAEQLTARALELIREANSKKAPAP